VSRAAALATIAAARRAGMAALPALWRHWAPAGTMARLLLAGPPVALVVGLSWPSAPTVLIGNRALLAGVLRRTAMLGCGWPVKTHVALLAGLARRWLPALPLWDLATWVVALPAEGMRAALGAIPPGRRLALRGRNLSRFAPAGPLTPGGRARGVTAGRLRRGRSAVGMVGAWPGGC
jgi:hypothetical protein